jgi:hypothetical protein
MDVNTGLRMLQEHRLDDGQDDESIPEDDSPEILAAKVRALRPVAKRIAASLYRKMIVGVAADYKLAKPPFFRGADLDFYDDATRCLRRAGYRAVVDVNPVHISGGRKVPVLLRLLPPPDGQSWVAVYRLQPAATRRHFPLRWWWRLTSKVPSRTSWDFVEIDTALSDGGFFKTIIASALIFDLCPHCRPEILSGDVRPEEAVRRHDERLRAFLETHPELKVLPLSDLDAYAASQERQEVLKRTWRRSIGGVTQEELRRLTKENFPYIADAVQCEMRRLLAGKPEEDETDELMIDWETLARPYWSVGITPVIAELLRTEILKRGLGDQIREGLLTVQGHEEFLSCFSCLLRACMVELRQDLWPEIVARYLEDYLEKWQKLLALELPLRDFERVAPNLSMSYCPKQDPMKGFPRAEPSPNLLCREDVPGYWNSFVIESPKGPWEVSRSMLAHWGKTSAEVFNIALQNQRFREWFLIEPLEKAPFPCWRIKSRNKDLVNGVLLLKDKPELLGKCGAFLVIGPSEMLLATVRSQSVAEAKAELEDFYRFAQRRFFPGMIRFALHPLWVSSERLEQVPEKSAGVHLLRGLPQGLVTRLRELSGDSSVRVS